MNVLTTEGEDWKRHRRIAAPAFNQTTYRNVWESTVRVYKDILNKEGWESQSSVTIANFSHITHKVSRVLVDHISDTYDVDNIFLKLALFIISICGFGISMPWNFPKRTQDGKLSLQEAVFEVATSILIRSRTPMIFYSLPIKRFLFNSSHPCVTLIFSI